MTRPRMRSAETTDARAASGCAAPDDEQALESGSSAVPSERHGVPSGRSRLWRAASVVVALGLLVLLAFAPLSALLGDHAVPPSVLPPDIGRGPHIPGVTSGLRDVPVGLPAGTRIRTVQDILPYAVAALGPAGAQSLATILTEPDSSRLLVYMTVGNEGGIGGDYPYRYPPLEALLDAAPPDALRSGGTALGAALTMLTAQPQPIDSPVPGISNAAPAAFAILDRMRAGGACEPQLNLLLLLAGEDQIHPKDLADEQRRTEVACPHDATPAWLVGQSQLHNQPITLPEDPRNLLRPYWRDLKRTSEGVTTMVRLVADHPTAIGALTGLGDAYLVVLH